jgi:hypothetical protein
MLTRAIAPLHGLARTAAISRGRWRDPWRWQHRPWDSSRLALQFRACAGIGPAIHGQSRSLMPGQFGDVSYRGPEMLGSDDATSDPEPTKGNTISAYGNEVDMRTALRNVRIPRENRAGRSTTLRSANIRRHDELLRQCPVHQLGCRHLPLQLVDQTRSSG